MVSNVIKPYEELSFINGIPIPTFTAMDKGAGPRNIGPDERGVAKDCELCSVA